MAASGSSGTGEPGSRVTKTVRDTLERAGTKMSVVVRAVSNWSKAAKPPAGCEATSLNVLPASVSLRTNTTNERCRLPSTLLFAGEPAATPIVARAV